VFLLALRDGSGPWTRVVPTDSGSAFSFNVTQPTASVALVNIDSGVTRTTVYQYTASEIAAAAASECTLYPDGSTRSAGGQVAGLSASEQALVSMGFWTASSLGGGYSLQNLPAGPLDLVAMRTGFTPQLITFASRGVLRRALNPPSGATLAPIDLNGAESFPMTSATWTFGNTGGEAFGVAQKFTTAGGTTGHLASTIETERTVAARTVYGVPAAQTIAGDLHQVVATMGTAFPARPRRQIIAYARTIVDRSLDFGPALPPPTVTVLPGAPAGRLRAQGALPAEYGAGVAVEWKSTGPNARFASLFTTRGFLGGTSTYDVQMPDLTALVGWDGTWNIRAGDLTNWWVSGGGPVLDVVDARYLFDTTKRRWAGAQTGITAPGDGSVFRMARASGTIMP
jgi:hypothetical protein